MSDDVMYVSRAAMKEIEPYLERKVIGLRSAYIDLLCEGAIRAGVSPVKVLMRRWRMKRYQVATILRKLMNAGYVRISEGWIEAIGGHDRQPSAFLEEGGSWTLQRQRVFERDGFACVYCGDAHGPLHADHVKPRIQGGTDEMANLVTACRTCNCSKGGRTPEEWSALSARVTR